MTKKTSTFIFGFLAFSIYFSVIGLLVFYFNTRHENKSVHYVKKNENRIQVALSSPPKIEYKKAVNPKPKVKAKPKPKGKPKKVIKKKVIKEKVVKKVIKKKEQKLTKPKNKALDLFANVKTTKKKNLIIVSDTPINRTPKNNLIKVSDKPVSASERIHNSLKNQKSSDSGVENAYLAKVQRMLEGWPAQSEYAGEKVKVQLLIKPTGRFEFNVKTASNNENFNSGLIEYLEQLQSIGFGYHKGDRTYNFEAEFIAKE